MIDHRSLWSSLADRVAAACDLLELLGQHFTAAKVDYEYAESINRFLIFHAGLWHAVSFSDTTLMVRAPQALLEDIVRILSVHHIDIAQTPFKH